MIGKCYDVSPDAIQKYSTVPKAPHSPGVENLHNGVKLLLAPIGMHCPQSSDLFLELFWPNPLSSFSRRPGLLIERLDVVVAFS